ncbi:E3 ubiquitin-protein ligase TRIM58-like [Myripristis murdjan]|uniref:E3 ubiquitin-protein ligase TRIM58-like n=1 Tax=Myripristis murdjan TaxID=586833 RepID=UPI00117629A4|nr:E3 ubiquitin-protein ligase TRIM58-like [Myripristis murdjan]
MAASKSASETARRTRLTKTQDKAWEKVTPSSSEPWNKPTLSEIQDKAWEKVTPSSSEPWNKPTLNDVQKRDLQKQSSSYKSLEEYSASKPHLKDLQSLTECFEFIKELEVEVKEIFQMKYGSKREEPEGGATKPRSLEGSRRLIVRWAKKLEQMNTVKKETKVTEEKTGGAVDPEGTEKSLEKQNERLLQWAVELRNVKEANGLSDEELRELLCPRGVKESRLTAILPLLEFVAWSLLSQDTEEDICKMWLPTKQKAWKTGTRSPRYIPNSVWQWIQSASVSVQLDPSSSHPWLVVSADRLQVQEAARLQHSADSSQRFTGWSCVLGDRVITAGRHYWEVDVSHSGRWRLGVTSVSARRKQKVPMSPSTGYWILWQDSRLWACTEDPTELPGVAAPRLVGVYVDFDEGQVSFYNVDSRAHIYTFSHTFRHSLLPVFGCMDGDTVLKIIPAEVSVSAPLV